jgi:hypothetical protein
MLNNYHFLFSNWSDIIRLEEIFKSFGFTIYEIRKPEWTEMYLVSMHYTIRLTFDGITFKAPCISGWCEQSDFLDHHSIRLHHRVEFDHPPTFDYSDLRDFDLEQLAILYWFNQTAGDLSASPIKYTTAYMNKILMFLNRGNGEFKADRTISGDYLFHLGRELAIKIKSKH